jgi:hypothetical protein
MNKKSETTPGGSLHRSHRLNAYLAIIVSASMFIPVKNWFGDLSFIYILVFGVVVVGLLTRIVVAGEGLNASQKKGFYSSGDYLDEAMTKGIKWAWFASLLYTGLLIILSGIVNSFLSREMMIKLYFGIIFGGPSIVYLLITGKSSQREDA